MYDVATLAVGVQELSMNVMQELQKMERTTQAMVVRENHDCTTRRQNTRESLTEVRHVLRNHQVALDDHSTTLDAYRLRLEHDFPEFRQAQQTNKHDLERLSIKVGSNHIALTNAIQEVQGIGRNNDRRIDTISRAFNDHCQKVNADLDSIRSNIEEREQSLKQEWGAIQKKKAERITWAALLAAAALVLSIVAIAVATRPHA
jgi:hypothetical protein